MLNSNTVLWATVSSAEKKCAKHAPGHRQVIPKGNQEIAGAAECLWAHNYPVGVCNCIFHTRNYLFAPLPAYFCMRFKCLSLRIWPCCLKIQNLPKVLLWMSGRHQGFKQAKGLFYLILLTYCLTWNWYFAADDFSSLEYFPWKFWHAADEPCSTSEGRGDVCLPYRKEMQRNSIKWGWSLRSCQIRKMEGNIGGCAKGLSFAVKQPDICSGFKYL